MGRRAYGLPLATEPVATYLRSTSQSNPNIIG